MNYRSTALLGAERGEYYRTLLKVISVLLVLGVLLNVTSAVAEKDSTPKLFSLNRIGLSGGYPFVFDEPIGFTFGDYAGKLGAAIEMGYYLSESLDATARIQFEMAEWNYELYDEEMIWSYYFLKLGVGIKAYLLPGSIRPYGLFELGTSIHLGENNFDVFQIESFGFLVGAGLGCQIFVSPSFYLEPGAVWQLHLADKYSIRAKNIKISDKYENMPMSVFAYLGFGFVF